MSGAAVERFEAWWAEKQRTEFRHAFADAPDLHGGDRERRWGAAYQDKERVAYLAGHDAAIAALTAELQQCREALAWALPLAERAVETHRIERVQAGHHDIRGTYKNGVTWVGVYQNEVDEIESARAALKEGA